MAVYRDLTIWQKSIRLVTDIYRIPRGYPQEERYGLISQMRRCSVSIPSNIAEGYGRNSNKEFVRFLQMTMGSVFELQTQLEVSRNLNYLSEENYQKSFQDSREVEHMISSFIASLRSKMK